MAKPFNDVRTLPIPVSELHPGLENAYQRCIDDSKNPPMHDVTPLADELHIHLKGLTPGQRVEVFVDGKLIGRETVGEPSAYEKQRALEEQERPC